MESREDGVPSREEILLHPHHGLRTMKLSLGEHELCWGYNQHPHQTGMEEGRGGGGASFSIGWSNLQVALIQYRTLQLEARCEEGKESLTLTFPRRRWMLLTSLPSTSLAHGSFSSSCSSSSSFRSALVTERHGWRRRTCWTSKC